MIPKILHRIWLGGEAPPVYQGFLDRWRDLHPGWEIIEWGDGNLNWLKNQTLFDNAASYVPEDAVYQMKSDVARYEILERFGGIYFDADTEPLRPFDDLLDAEAFAGWEVPGQFIANGLIGAVPDHPLMKKLIDVLPEWADRNRGRPATFVCGPRLFSHLYFEMQPNIVVHPKHTFYPYLHDDLKKSRHSVDPASVDYSGSYAVHHWNHKRNMKGLMSRLSSIKGGGNAV